MLRKDPLITDHIYHIVNRGVEKRSIFMGERDYVRFLLNTHASNGGESLKNIERISTPDLFSFLCKVKPCTNGYVKILAFCLMSNHFHLLVKQRIDNGITDFMQKLGTGYTMYVNKKYSRVGPLFQGTFKTTLIKDDRHFLYVPHYIHLNPLGALANQPDTTSDEKLLFLRRYQWSSFNDYDGNPKFPGIIALDLLERFGGINAYRDDFMEFLKKERTEDTSNDNISIFL